MCVVVVMLLVLLHVRNGSVPPFPFLSSGSCDGLATQATLVDPRPMLPCPLRRSTLGRALAGPRPPDQVTRPPPPPPSPHLPCTPLPSLTLPPFPAFHL